MLRLRHLHRRVGFHLCWNCRREVTDYGTRGDRFCGRGIFGETTRFVGFYGNEIWVRRLMPCGNLFDCHRWKEGPLCCECLIGLEDAGGWSERSNSKLYGESCNLAPVVRAKVLFL